MKFITNGKIVAVNTAKWLIQWERKIEISNPQKKVKNFLYPYWKYDVVLEEFVIPKFGRLRIDLLNISKRVAIEVSPAQHYEFNKFFHVNEIGYLNAIKRDMKKEQWIKDNNFTYVEIMDEDMDKLSPKWFLDKYEVIL